MTDRPSPIGGPALRRWPADPTQLVDTTRCPACFSSLSTTRCGVCGLDLGVPEAAELLQRSTAVYRGELARQELIARMREAQAAREAWVELPATSVPVERCPTASDGDAGRCRRAGGIRRRPDPARRVDGCRDRGTVAAPPAAAPSRRGPAAAADSAAAPACPERAGRHPPPSAGAAGRACRSSCSRSAWCSSPSPRSCSSSSPTWWRASRCARSSSRARACSCSASPGCCALVACRAPPRAWPPSRSCCCCSTCGSCGRTSCSAASGSAPRRTRAWRSRSSRACSPPRGP